MTILSGYFCCISSRSRPMAGCIILPKSTNLTAGSASIQVADEGPGVAPALLVASRLQVVDEEAVLPRPAVVGESDGARIGARRDLQAWVCSAADATTVNLGGYTVVRIRADRGSFKFSVELDAEMGYR